MLLTPRAREPQQAPVCILSPGNAAAPNSEFLLAWVTSRCTVTIQEAQTVTLDESRGLMRNRDIV